MFFDADVMRRAYGAPLWKQWAARVFGDKIVTVDEANDRRVTMTAYRWRGILYVTSFSDVLMMRDRSSGDEERK